MNCPVCPTQDIPKDAAACPNCKTDLTPILRIRELAEAEYNEALSLFQHGAIDAAMRHTAAALAMDANFALAKKLMGKLLLNSGQISAARSVLEEAKTLTPNDIDITNLLSKANEIMVRTTRFRVIGVVLSLMIIITAGVLLVILPLMSSNRRYAEINEHLSAMESYRSSHRYANVEFEKLESNLESSKTTQTDLQRSLEAYRAIHRFSDEEYESVLDTVSNLNIEVTKIQSEFTNLGASYASLSNAIEQQRGDYEQFFQHQTEERGQYQTQLTNWMAALMRNDAMSLNGMRSSVVEPVPAIDLAVPGVTIKKQASRLILYFDSGLFSQGTLLRPGARQILVALGNRLGVHSEQISLEIEGFVDEKPLFSEASTLGRKRAIAVAEIFHDSCGFPIEMITIRGMGLRSLPFLNDSSENRSKNRTVVIQVSVKKGVDPQ